MWSLQLVQEAHGGWVAGGEVLQVPARVDWARLGIGFASIDLCVKKERYSDSKALGVG